MGSFEALLIGIWGPGVELLVDPYTLRGQVRVTAFLTADVAIRTPKSFAVAKDMVTT